MYSTLFVTKASRSSWPCIRVGVPMQQLSTVGRRQSDAQEGLLEGKLHHHIKEHCPVHGGRRSGRSTQHCTVLITVCGGVRLVFRAF